MNKGYHGGQHRNPVNLLLATTVYLPTSLADYSTTSATFVDLDATLLAVTFVAPQSGKVLVQLCADAAAGGAGTYHQWNLRDSNGDIAGTGVRTTGNFGSSSEVGITRDIVVTGLTPGMTYTWKWGHRRDAGSGTPHTYAQASAGPGPASMKVFGIT